MLLETGRDFFWDRRRKQFFFKKDNVRTNLIEPKMCHSFKPPREIRVCKPEVKPPGNLMTVALSDDYELMRIQTSDRDKERMSIKILEW